MVLVTHDSYSWGSRFLIFIGPSPGITTAFVNIQRDVHDDYPTLAVKVVDAFTNILSA